MRILISTGEVSGDLQGSLLIQALHKEAKRRSISLEIDVLGGRRMEEAGANLIADTSPIGAIGLLEAIPHVFPTWRAQIKLNDLIKTRKPDLVVLIDYMGPNIRLGNKLKKLIPHIPIIYYIAPQEWAWRIGDGGTTDLISFSDKILSIFKKEAEFYIEKGGNVTWVGHPMIDTLEVLPDRLEACKQLGIKNNSKLLLLMPASRNQELRYILPTLIKTAAILQKLDPSLNVIVPSGLSKFETKIYNSLKRGGVVAKVIPAEDVDSLKPFLFAAADLALGKSGTINMELALNNVPQIVGYKVSRVTALLARRILNFDVEHISPVNLLLNERLVPEFVQEDFKAESVVPLAKDLLQDKSESRSNMIQGYARLRNVLGERGVTDRAAIQILNTF